MRQVDHDFFPDHTAISIAQKMRLIQNHEISLEIYTLVHGIVELVAKDFSCSNNYWCIGVFLAVTSQNTYTFMAEFFTKFQELGIGQGLER